VRDRDLDFIVIGVQKGGTTSLWQYLRDHPEIAMPGYKEAPILCREWEQVPGILEQFMDGHFSGAGEEVKLGKVATHYMMGNKTVSVERVAERIARVFPEVRLIALLRDPIERAMSHYRMSARRGWEIRSFDRMVEELLEPDWLEIGRTRASETNSYIVQGEYARILRCYRKLFSAEQLHIEMTAELSRRPEGVIDRVLAFLGLSPGYRPDDLDVRYHRSGILPRLDREGEAQLRAFMSERIFPQISDEIERRKAALAFAFFLETWNVIPDDRRPALSSANRSRLEAHYRADGELLADLGVEAPWLDAWVG
jgi:hypothetical protein